MAEKGKISNTFSGLPLKALLGAPLKATADANAMLARSQTQFILSTCFDKSDSGDKLIPKMITFKLERGVINPDGSLSKEKVGMDFSIPLLSIIPLNTLAVDELDVSFEMEVKSSTEHNHETHDDLKHASEGKLTNSYKSDRYSCEMHGTLARKSSRSDDSSESSSAHARYDIKLHAGQSPLPTGLTTILDIFSKNIAPIQLKKDGN